MTSILNCSNLLECVVHYVPFSVSSDHLYGVPIVLLVCMFLKLGVRPNQKLAQVDPLSGFRVRQRIVEGLVATEYKYSV